LPNSKDSIDSKSKKKLATAAILVFNYAQQVVSGISPDFPQAAVPGMNQLPQFSQVAFAD
jgi:hypothetical protein